MAIQGASLIITKDGSAVSYPIRLDAADPLGREDQFLQAQAAVLLQALALNQAARADLRRQNGGAAPGLAEDPADPRESNLSVAIVADHGRKGSRSLYEGEGMSVAQRDWVASFYETAAALVG